MHYLIKHANGECTPVQSTLTLEDLFSLIRKNEDRFILFNQADDIVFLGTDYLSCCMIVPVQEPDNNEVDEAVISDFF